MYPRVKKYNAMGAAPVMDLVPLDTLGGALPVASMVQWSPEPEGHRAPPAAAPVAVEMLQFQSVVPIDWSGNGITPEVRLGGSAPAPGNAPVASSGPSALSSGGGGGGGGSSAADQFKAVCAASQGKLSTNSAGRPVCTVGSKAWTLNADGTVGQSAAASGASSAAGGAAGMAVAALAVVAALKFL